MLKRRNDQEHATRSLALQNTPSGTFVALPLGAQKLAQGEVLIEVEASTLCEADRRAISGSKYVSTRPFAVVLGHEAVGRIRQAAKGTGYRRGDLVVVMPHQVPADQRGTEAFKRGHIFQLRSTLHAGMHTHGTMSRFVRWPAEWARPIPREVLKRVRDVARARGLHESAVLAEIEHVGCVFRGEATMLEAEHTWGDGRLENKLRQGRARVLVSGAGWMGWLWFIHLNRRYPGTSVFIRETDETRQRRFREVAKQAGFTPPRVLSIDNDAERESFDLAIMTTSARPAAEELFHWIRPGGHLVLFSGIHGGTDKPLFDPAELSNLERLHRGGMHARLYRTDARDPKDTIIASGTSGYCVATFERAVREIADVASAVAAGITGVVLGLESPELRSLDPKLEGFVCPAGHPVLETVVPSNWPGRLQHLKLVVHPFPTAEVRAVYGKEGV